MTSVIMEETSMYGLGKVVGHRKLTKEDIAYAKKFRKEVEAKWLLKNQ